MGRAISFRFFVAALAAASAALLFPQQSEAALTDGLTGYWTFNGPDVTWTSATEGTATDKSGNGRTGSFSGMNRNTASTNGKLGQGLAFDGSNDSVTTGVSMSTFFTASAATIAVWVKPTGSISGIQPLVTSDFGDLYIIRADANNIAVRNWNGSSDDEVLIPYTNDEWAHIVLVHTGGVLYGYKNGAVVNSTPSGNSAELTNDLLFGDDNVGSDNFRGSLDDVRVYNRGLTSAEVKQLYLKGNALQKPPNNLGLVGYWSFNEGTGTRTGDFSGQGNAGTLSGPAWVDGKRGKALSFNGADPDSVTFGDIAIADFGTNPFSVTFWMRTGGDGKMLVKTPTGVCNFGNFWEIGMEGGLLSVSTDHSNGGDFMFLQSNASPDDNVWHHIIVTRSGTLVSIYIDGVFDNSDTMPVDTNFSNAGSFVISEHPCIGVDGSIPYTGLLDEVRIYNRALGATEIAKLYGSGAVKFTSSSVALQSGSTLGNGLVGHWTFDGPDITTNQILDRSGQGNHGGFFGGATSSAKTIGKLGQALRFDRVNDYIDVTPAADDIATGAFSVAAWFNRDTTNAQLIFSIEDDFSDNDIGLGFVGSGICTGSILCGYLYDGSEYDITESSQTTFNLGTWYHVVYTYNTSSGQQLYVDGVSVGTNTATGRGTGNSADWANIGASAATHLRLWGGSLDDLRTYNRALTATEVKQLYNLGGAVIKQ